MVAAVTMAMGRTMARTICFGVPPELDADISCGDVPSLEDPPLPLLLPLLPLLLPLLEPDVAVGPELPPNGFDVRNAGAEEPVGKSPELI